MPLQGPWDGIGAFIKQTVNKFIVNRQLLTRAREAEAEAGAEETKEEEGHVASVKDFYLVIKSLLGEDSDYVSEHVGATINQIVPHYVGKDEIVRPDNGRSVPQFMKVAPPSTSRTPTLAA